MTITPKDWKDYPDTTTPMTAAALEDMESRLGGYADAVSPGVELVEVIGHSLAAGGGARWVPASGYANRARTAIGALRFREYALGGAIACWPNSGTTGDGGYPHVLQNMLRPGNINMPVAGPPYSPMSQVVIVNIGLNDLAAIGSNKPLPFQTALRTILARACASSVWEDTDAAWAKVGTWVTLGTVPVSAYNSGAGISYTVTVNDKATFTAPATMPASRVVGVGLWLNPAWTAVTYGIKVDGAVRPDITLTPSAMTDLGVANKYIVHTLRFGTGGAGDAAFAAGAHTIELTLKSGSGLAIDSAHVEADPLDGPVLVTPLPNKPANYSLWGSWAYGPNSATNPMNDAGVEVWKSAHRAINAEFPGRTVEVDMETLGIVRTADGNGDFIADGAHPNDRGHEKIALGVKNALVGSRLLTDRVKSAAIPVPRPIYRLVGSQSGAGVFMTGWVNFPAANLPTLRWVKDDRGRVNLIGAIQAGTGAAAGILAAGTLPKPARSIDFAIGFYNNTAWSGAFARVQSDGAFALLGAPNLIAGNTYTFNISYESELA